ncbi:hypothetical protein SAMN05216371_7040 [Streptomyces sp. TLI_053]|uniref:hypothetical protein n=1 Tax=Streptomyces sp. TLI_053 TaxID=1855352 RepID=UPI00087979DA|nr:hypothetical protein [Streptomyces sp. TLI_053]SDT82229.1 hypothetical protein SAMN05216371_7040 [Streptomyces sp. TLI_053]
MIRARNIRKRAALTATSAALALALVSGCGGDGGSPVADTLDTASAGPSVSDTAPAVPTTDPTTRAPAPTPTRPPAPSPTGPAEPVPTTTAAPSPVRPSSRPPAAPSTTRPAATPTARPSTPAATRPATTAPPAGGASSLWGGQYRGTARVTVQLYDYCSLDGARRPAGSQTYSMATTLSVERPREAGGQRESNPFALVISVGPPGQTGAVGLGTSVAVATGSGQLLLTYWKLSWDSGTLRGQLTDNHVREAAALNLINWATLLVPCRPELGTLPGGMPHSVAVGASLSGKLTATSTSLTAKGASDDGLVEFTFEFSGSR